MISKNYESKIYKTEPFKVKLQIAILNRINLIRSIYDTIRYADFWRNSTAEYLLIKLSLALFFVKK